MSTPTESTPTDPTTAPPTRKQKLKRWLHWTFFNGLFCFLMWLALWQGSNGAGNILLGLVWFSLLIHAILFVAVCARSDLRDDPLKSLQQGRMVPAFLNYVVGFGIAATFIWWGWWFCGIVAFVTELIESMAYNEAKKPHQPRNAQPARPRRSRSGELDNSELFNQLLVEARRQESRPAPRPRPTPEPRENGTAFDINLDAATPTRQRRRTVRPEPPPEPPRDTRPRIELD